MPAKSEKQRKFFGAVMGAKKGQTGVTGAAKKAAKDMPEKEIKKFLKKESFDTLVDNILTNLITKNIEEAAKCEAAEKGCDCHKCPACRANQKKEDS